MSFQTDVYAVVKQIPSGYLASYGQIASLIGNPRAARQVGFALRALGVNEKEVPWWRVVNKKGYLSINQGEGGAEKEEQRVNLEVEGIEINEKFEVQNFAARLWNFPRAN